MWFFVCGERAKNDLSFFYLRELDGVKKSRHFAEWDLETPKKA